MNDQTIRCQRQLRILHENGISDAKIASWMHRELERLMDLNLEFVVSQPASQTIYRWRTGKSTPTNMVMMMLISRLFRQEKKKTKKEVKDAVQSKDK
jgi:DNA-binding MurR/RpiR family transcriptional regulator